MKLQHKPHIKKRCGFWEVNSRPYFINDAEAAAWSKAWKFAHAANGPIAIRIGFNQLQRVKGVHPYPTEPQAKWTN